MRIWHIYAAFAALILVACYMLFSGHAHAEDAPRAPCGPQEAVLKRLAEKYHENVVAMGSVSAAAAIVVTASEDGKTWSLLAVNKDSACLLSAGQDWLDSSKRKVLPK